MKNRSMSEITELLAKAEFVCALDSEFRIHAFYETKEERFVDENFHTHYYYVKGEGSFILMKNNGENVFYPIGKNGSYPVFGSEKAARGRYRQIIEARSREQKKLLQADEASVLGTVAIEIMCGCGTDNPCVGANGSYLITRDDEYAKCESCGNEYEVSSDAFNPSKMRKTKLKKVIR